MSLNSVQSFVIENCNGPTIENGLNNVCLHPLSRTFTFTFKPNDLSALNDLGLIPSRVKGMSLKFEFIASLLDVQH